MSKDRCIVTVDKDSGAATKNARHLTAGDLRDGDVFDYSCQPACECGAIEYGPLLWKVVETGLDENPAWIVGRRLDDPYVDVRLHAAQLEWRVRRWRRVEIKGYQPEDMVTDSD